MKRNLALIAVLLSACLVSNPIDAQEQRPFIVETLEATPTVTITGSIIKQTYKLRFPDLSENGKEILVLEDEVTPRNINVSPFEALDLKVIKEKVGKENIWYFTYTFRIVNRQKSSQNVQYKIPKIKFYWAEKEAGISFDMSNAVIKTFETSEVPINYVTTITDSSILDVRDRIALGNFNYGWSITFKIIAWALFLSGLLLFILNLAKVPASTLAERGMSRGRKPQNIEEQAPFRVHPTAREARRDFYSELKKINLLVPEFDNGTKDEAMVKSVVGRLHLIVKNLLIANFTFLSLSQTSEEIRKAIEENTRGDSDKIDTAFKQISESLVHYQNILDTEDWNAFLKDRPLGTELARLKEWADCMKWRAGLLIILQKMGSK